MKKLNKIFTYWRDDLKIKNNSRTTLAGIKISEKKKHKSDHEFTTDVITFNMSGGVPKDHPFTDREFPGALKVTEDTIETPVDLTKDMNEEELTKYVEREWNRGKYQAGKNG